MGYKWYYKSVIRVALDYVHPKNKKRGHMIIGVLLCLIGITSTIIAFPQSSIGQTNHSASQKSSKFIKITIDNGLISLKIKEANLQETFRELSKVSGVPIIILDPADTASAVISLTLEKVSTYEAVKRILNQISSGGLATETGIKGSNATNKIYVITKKGADTVQANTQQFLERIKKGEKPDPKEVENFLTTLFSTFGIVDPQGTGMYAVPVFLMINKNYKSYKNMVLRFFSNQDTLEVQRTVMLEIIDNHWEDPNSEKTVRLVFMNAGESPTLLGKSAKTLAGHGVNIGDELMNRYELANNVAKSYYAVALSLLGRKEAIPLLKLDLGKSEDMTLKASIIRSLARLDPNDVSVAEAFNQIVHSSSIENRSPGVPVDTNVEALSMQAVLAMAKSKKPETFRKLVEIANNDALPVDVRLTAVESLQKTSKEKMPRTIDTLTELRKKVMASKALDEVDKDRFYRIIKRILLKNPPN